MSGRLTRTEKCPGCGEVTPFYKGSVCAECRANIEDGKAWRIKTKATNLANAGRAVYSVSGSTGTDGAFKVVSHWNPRFRCHNDYAIRDCIDRPFWKLVELLSSPVSGAEYGSRNEHKDVPRIIDTPWREDRDYQGLGKHVLMRSDVRALLNELFTAVNNSMENAYKSGHKRGSSLLLGMADGSMAVNEVNDRTISGK